MKLSQAASGVAAVVLGMVLPSFASIFIILFYLAGQRKPSWQGANFYSILVALFLSSLNSTKVLESDLLEYSERYRAAGSVSFIEYIQLGFSGVAREPIFKAITFIGYYLTVGNFGFFVFLISFAIYQLQFSAMIKFCRATRTTSTVALLGISLLAFLPQYFSLSAHLLRQLLATSLIIYLLASIDGRKIVSQIILFSTALFIHSSVVIFGPTLPFLGRKLKHELLVVIAAVGLFSLYGNRILSLFLSGSDAYIAQRILAADSLVESGSGLSFGLWSMALLVLLIAVYHIYNKRPSSADLIMLNSNALLGAICIGLTTLTLLQYRYLFMLYSFLPYLVIVLTRPLSLGTQRHLLLLLVPLFMMSFLYGIVQSPWKYVDIEIILAGNPILYLLLGRGYF